MKMSEAVKEIRKRLGQTQQAFATRMGWSISTIVKYESERIPNADALARLVVLSNENGWTDLAQILGAFRNDRLERYASMVADYGHKRIGLILSEAIKIDKYKGEWLKKVPEGARAELEGHLNDIAAALKQNCEAMESTIGNSDLNPFIVNRRKPEIKP